MSVSSMESPFSRLAAESAVLYDDAITRCALVVLKVTAHRQLLLPLVSLRLLLGSHLLFFSAGWRCVGASTPPFFGEGGCLGFLVLSLTRMPPTSVPARAARLLSARWLPAVDEGAAFGWLVLEAAVVRSLQLVASPRPKPRLTWLTVDATPALRAHCATLQPIFPLSSAEVGSAELLSEWPSPVMLAAVGPPVFSPTYLAVSERASGPM
jgi:hypothetical protein